MSLLSVAHTLQIDTKISNSFDWTSIKKIRFYSALFEKSD